jgi:hypothetical protein
MSQVCSRAEQLTGEWLYSAEGHVYCGVVEGVPMVAVPPAAAINKLAVLTWALSTLSMMKGEEPEPRHFLKFPRPKPTKLV